MSNHINEAAYRVNGSTLPSERDIAWAQTHALIAVAEQLRLANLIAITTNEQTSGARYTADMIALADPAREDQSIDRDELAAFLDSPTHAPKDTHSGRDGSCLDCPWPVHKLPPADLADAIIAHLTRDHS